MLTEWQPITADIAGAMPLPRFVSPPHPQRASTWADSAITFTRGLPIHLGRVTELRPWQRYVLDRALECDKDGRLLWRTVIISAPRQVGKSVLERVMAVWRLHQSQLFGQRQDILHIAHKLATADEVWRPAAYWARDRYGVRSVMTGAGKEKITLPDGSRWMIHAATDGAGVGFALTMVLVDEAWRVARSVVDGALAPTLLEAEQPQLWLVSTAGTSTSDLFRTYRSTAMAGLDDTLIIEWSAPEDAELDIADPAVWQAASPHWDERRAAYIRSKLGSTEEWQFRQQYLNQWVPRLTAPLVGPDLAQKAESLEPLPEGELAFGVDVSADRAHAAIVAYSAGMVELVEGNTDDTAGVAWVLPRLIDLCARWSPRAVGFDAGGPAAGIADALKGSDYADRVVMLNGREMCAASAAVFDRLSDGTLTYHAHPLIAQSIAGASRKIYGGAWQFSREGAPSGVPLLAATLAVWAEAHAPQILEASAIW